MVQASMFLFYTGIQFWMGRLPGGRKESVIILLYNNMGKIINGSMIYHILLLRHKGLFIMAMAFKICRMC